MALEQEMKLDIEIRKYLNFLAAICRAVNLFLFYISKEQQFLLVVIIQGYSTLKVTMQNIQLGTANRRVHNPTNLRY